MKEPIKELTKNYLPKSISRLGGKRSYLEEIKNEKKSQKSIRSERISKAPKFTKS